MKRTSEYAIVPGAKPELVDHQLIILADVKYVGQVLNQKRLAELKRQIAALSEERKALLAKKPQMNCWGQAQVNQDLHDIADNRRKVEREISELPRLEIWRREYWTLHR